MVFLFTGCSAIHEKPVIEEGMLDLSQWDFNRGVVVLEGNWAFYWNRFPVMDGRYTPSDPDGFVPVPGSWLKARLSGGNIIRPRGIGACLLHLKMPPGEHTLQIWVPAVHQAFELFLLQENAPPLYITGAGKTGVSREEYVPRIISAGGRINVQGDCALLLQVSSFDTALNPGIKANLLLGHEEKVERALYLKRQYDQLIQGGLFAISAFMFILFFLRRDNQAPLWLGLFAFTMNIRSIIVDGYFQEIFFTINTFIINMKLAYLTPALGLIFAVLYHRIVFRAYFQKTIASWVTIVSSLYILLTLFASCYVFTLGFKFFGVFMILVFCWIIFCYIKAFRDTPSMIMILSTVAVCITIITGIMDILVILAMVPGVRYFQLGVLAMILCNTIIVTFYIESNRRKAVELSRDLEMKIMKVQHKCDMADVTTGVLHNVKNLLNSVKITIQTTLNPRQKREWREGFRKVHALIKEKSDNLTHFLKDDPRGETLLTYCSALIDGMTKEMEEEEKNWNTLAAKLNAIEQIILSQQKYGGRITLGEVNLSEIIEDALIISSGDSLLRNVKIEKIYRPHPPLFLSRILLLHVLINLIKNAGEAMEGMKEAEKKLTFEIREEPEEVLLSIKDRGHGISRENLEKMFTHGFTTKARGNGYGLHSCKLYIEEMGGWITVASNGPGTGAEFTLVLRSMAPR